MEAAYLLVLIFGGIILFFIFLYFVPVNLWITALFSGVKVGLFELVFMRIRKVPPRVIVDSMITATKAGLQISTTELETHYLAGGNVPNVIRALISADKANISLSFKQATAIDLAGRDVFQAVQISVNPKVITTPKVAAVASDGIQLIAVARVTVRASIPSSWVVRVKTRSSPAWAKVSYRLLVPRNRTRKYWKAPTRSPSWYSPVVSTPALPSKFFPSILPT